MTKLCLFTPEFSQLMMTVGKTRSIWSGH